MALGASLAFDPNWTCFWALPRMARTSSSLPNSFSIGFNIICMTCFLMVDTCCSSIRFSSCSSCTSKFLAGYQSRLSRILLPYCGREAMGSQAMSASLTMKLTTLQSSDTGRAWVIFRINRSSLRDDNIIFVIGWTNLTKWPVPFLKMRFRVPSIKIDCVFMQ